VIVRRERAHPGAQLSFTDHDGHRFQAILTDQTGEIAQLEREHRGRTRVEDSKAEPKRLRYRLLHVAARLCFHARTATLRIQASWPWASELTIAFQRLRALPAPAA
jgi:hypothetical protein